ncbi:hypothetical protein [Cryobacterium sp. CG_9.6]|uniref:hypothetical protein n=1 Tax=Cryobacterium sp. CG_9.6 TaxID=2760710 RepID=UPI00247648CC|nr:hypothetical protein [Cryobacterium sp. CG_9.6]MDH6235271.1 hypothetical protein [Cryobacterium sp. CG_9.6]
MTAITDDLPARLLHEEHEGWQAIIAGQGADYFQRTMTQDALLVVPGGVISRNELSGGFALLDCDGYQLHEPAVIRLGNHGGIVVSRAVVRRGEETTQFFVSTTYVFHDGGWCIAAQQRTPTVPAIVGAGT